MEGQYRPITIAQPVPLRPSQRRVISTIGRHITMSRSELAAETGFPPKTVNRLVKELVDALIVHEGEPAPRPKQRGRPQANLSLVGPQGALVLVAQSHREVSVSTGSFGGAVQHGVTWDSPLPTDAAAVKGRWLQLATGVLRRQGLDWPGVAGVVVGLPLPLTLRRSAAPGRAMGKSSELVWQALGAWRDAVPLMARELACPVLVENDANLGALGEAIFGAGRASPVVLYLKIVNDIGAGLVIDGRLYGGAGGLAGELAHVSVADGPACPCGGRGCVAVVYGRGGGRPLFKSLYGSEISLTEAVDRAERGDIRASQSLAEFGRLLGRPLSGLCVMIDPALIVLDGQLRSGSVYVARGIREMVEQYAAIVSNEGMEIVGGDLGRAAEAQGALALFRQAYVDGLSVPDLGRPSWRPLS